MNQVFDAARFLRLLRAHWAESWRSYAWFFVVCAILNGVVLVMGLQLADKHRYVEFQQSTQTSWYAFGLVATGIVFATRFFDNFNEAGSTLIVLMKPASTFEKWCLALLYVGMLFPLAYTMVYLCMNYPAVAYAKMQYVPPTDHISTIPVFQIYLPFTSMHAESWPPDFPEPFYREELLFVFNFLAGVALCMSGRIYFKRAAVLKTWLLAFGLLVFGLCISALNGADPFIAGQYWTIYSEQRPTTTMLDLTVAYGILFGVPMLLWIGLYFHIKEREVS